jgi:GR25 family glycosyltransferase involved in LPS biosynthesis
LNIHAVAFLQLNILLEREQQKRCAITLEHVDVWYEIAERKVPLGLILEDDAMFVPFFKEKFTRMIYAAVNSGALRINGTCAKPTQNKMQTDEWIHQNPMIVIGTCFNFHVRHFQKQLRNASPLLSTHKLDASRCTHAYLLTQCSAEALVNQLQAQKNDFLASDWLQNMLFPLSPTLQSFWMDPPLAYQGNQVIDIDKLSSFKTQTYLQFA